SLADGKLFTVNITTNSTSRNDPSFATAVVNTQILTIFHHQGAQVYVYGAFSNENENEKTPEKWIFYYVPVMAPTQSDMNNDTWISVVNGEIRLKLMLGNSEVQELARKAIVNNDKNAHLVMQKIRNGDYEIEIAFYFAGFKQVTTNFISITSDQLKNVLSKTSADGGNTNAQYIHRNQASKFVGNYMTNVKKMIYLENTNTNLSLLTNGLEEQFISLLQQGMNSAQQTQLDAALFDQVWSSSDLNPDRLTSELSKLFTYNDTETKRRNDTNTYFDLNKQSLQSTSNSHTAHGGGGVSIFGLGSIGGSGGSTTTNTNSLQDMLMQTNHDIYSLTEIQRLLSQQQSEFHWNGEKFVPKSFNVYKLVDLTDRVQVAILSKQLIADKTNGAIIRSINPVSTPTVYANKPSTFLTGVIQLYSVGGIPPYPWLLCDGTAVSRVRYQRLFSVIGTSYGVGDGLTTFNLPDFRGRFPLGVDQSSLVVINAGKIGGRGGTYSTLAAGSHSHSYYDPGHNHGGHTGTSAYSGGTMTMHTPKGGRGSDHGFHSHYIASDKTRISINTGGDHSHSIVGQSGAVGGGRAFSILNPYQTVNYIIYSD
ncbi:unnamed protein product, partial [Didymodactylos carnosus]